MWRLIETLLLVLAVLFGLSADVGPPSAPPEEPLSVYLERLALDLLRQSPQTITTRGAAAELGLRNDGLDGLALDATGASYAPLAEAVERIRTADLSRETWSVDVAATAFAAWLQSALDARPYLDYTCLVSPYLTSVPQSLAWFMVHVHPLACAADAEDYLTRLALFPLRFDELATRLEASERRGALAPAFLLHRTADEIEAIGRGRPGQPNLLAHFLEGLAGLADMEPDDRQSLADRAVAVVTDTVAPAYIKLAGQVRDLAARVSDEIGVWRLEGGAEYYAYLARAYTTTDKTPDEIYAFGQREVARVQAEVRAAAAVLGYDVALPIPDLFAQLRADCGTVSGSAAVEACQALVAEMTERARPAFARWPQARLVVLSGQNIAYFAEGTRDGARPGAFYVPVDQVRPACSLRSLVCHETVPGHFLQSAMAQESNLPRFRDSVFFSGYAEGWATYAERLAWELGAYENDPHGNLGRLQEELFRAARLVVDPGIHVMRWTYEQAIAYMTEATGLDEATVRDEVDRYIVNPGQAVSYGIGLAEILALRERAREALGPAFDLAQFHEAVLSCGNVPLPVLKRVVDRFVATRTAQSSPPPPGAAYSEAP